jgi:hypothetical protein
MKVRIGAFCLMLSVSILAGAQAATMNDLLGVWGISSSDTLTVKGLGTDTGSSSGTCTFADNTYAAVLSSGPSIWNYAGGVSLDGKGKKLSWNMGPGGTDELKDVIEEWIVDWAEAEGYILHSVQVVFQSVTCKAIKIDKTTNRPGSALLKVKGSVSGYVDGDYVSRKISYTSQVSFVSGPQR